MLSDLVGPGIMGSAGGLENENSSTIKANIDPRRIIDSPRIVFTPFDAGEFARTLEWIDERGLSRRMVTRDYASLAAHA